MSDQTFKDENYLEEARKLMKLIEESKLNLKDWAFFMSMKGHVKNNAFIGWKQIFWLRDIKDKQLEPNFKEYDDRKDRYRD